MTVEITGTGGIDLENYNLDEDSSGNLIIVDPDGNTVFTYDNTANSWVLGDNLDINANAIEDTNQSYVDFANDIGASGDRVNIFSSDINTSTVTDPDTATAYDVANDLDKSDVDDDEKIFFGTNDDYSLRYATSGDELILRDETNATDLLTLPKNTDISQILESGGGFELSVGGLSGDLADEQDPKAHATEHEDGGVDEIDVSGLSGDLADAQDPKTHSSTHNENGSDELLVEGLGTSSTDTTKAFKPDGGGGVQVAATGGNVPNWQEDANSPLDASGPQSHTFTLSGTYDMVKVIIHEILDETGSGQSLELRLNGDTGGNYNFVDLSGTQSGGASQFTLVPTFGNGENYTGRLQISGRWTSLAQVLNNGVHFHDPADMDRGANFNISSPLDSITFRGGTGNISVKVRVYGLDI